jgi:integrase/recombinase XerC
MAALGTPPRATRSIAMHASVERYLTTLAAQRRSPHTLRAVRLDLVRFVAWWEATRRRTFDPALLRQPDLLDWRRARQVDDGAAPATINRALASLRGYATWALAAGLLAENPALDVSPVPAEALAPRGLPPEATDALLRAAGQEPHPTMRARDEAVLALLVYAGLRVQEVCDAQLRDLDLAGGTITVRSGKAGTARRVPLHPEAQRLVRRYLERVRCLAAAGGG